MALWDKLMGEFVDVIEWTDDSSNTLVYRFERYGNEIKNGAKLTVREGQMAIMVHEGELADQFGPGMYELRTANLPILSTIQNWPHGFESPFKSEIYFFNMRQFTDLKWGTKNPVILRDPEFGPVRLRAFGTYVIRIKDPRTLLTEIVGTDGHFTTAEITDQLRNVIVSRFSNALGSSGIPVLDLAGNYDQLGQFITSKIAPEIAAYGIELTKMLVENVSLPKSVEEALDRRTSMGVIGDLSRYTQFQAAEAMRAAAEQPGGAAGAGVGMGAGLAMGQQMAAAMMGGQMASPQAAPAAGGAPPPIPQETLYHVAIDGAAQGPFPVSQIGQKIRSGDIARTTLVWCDGMANWQAAAEVTELKPLFTSVPPPLPS